MVVNLLPQLSKLANNVSCMTIQHRFISSADLAWVVQGNHLISEASCFPWWVIFTITSLDAMMDILDRHILDTEIHIFPKKSLIQNFTVYLNRIYSSCSVDWSKGNHQACLTAPVSTQPPGTVPIITNFADILEEQTQRPVSENWWQDVIQRFEQLGFLVITILTGDFRYCEPRHICTWFQHISFIPMRNLHKFYPFGL